MPSEEELKAQESAEKEKGEKGDKSGDKDKFASKEDLAAITSKLEEQGRKSDEVLKLITSPEFMNRSAPPPPPPKTEEKTVSTEEVDKMEPSQLVAHMLKEVGKMVKASSDKQEESIKSVAASIKLVVDEQADKDAGIQVAQLVKDYGEDAYEKHRDAMYKIVGDAPGISLERAYLIAIGEESPPKKAEARKGTETEKGGQEAEFTETDLSPKEASKKAYDKVFGANKKPI